MIREQARSGRSLQLRSKGWWLARHGTGSASGGGSRLVRADPRRHSRGAGSPRRARAPPREAGGRCRRNGRRRAGPRPGAGLGGAGSVMRLGAAALPRDRSFRCLPARDERWGVPPPRAGAMLGGGARAAKPSFVSYISPEVRSRAGGAGQPRAPRPGRGERCGAGGAGPGLPPGTVGLSLPGLPRASAA